MKSIFERFAETKEKYPEKAAFVSENTSLTFKELFNMSGALATALILRTVHKKPVVIFMKKSPEEAAAFIGVLMSGNFYIPIDEEMPERRIKLILDNVKAPLIICDAETLTVARTFSTEALVVTYDELVKTGFNKEMVEGVQKDICESDPAYVLFTSGSTGVPKGVVSSISSLINYIDRLSEVLKTDENNIFGAQAPFYFDASLKEIYSCIFKGATVHIIPKRLFTNPGALIEYLNDKRINTLCWVVSALTFLSAFGALDDALPKYVHTITFVGEVFPIKQFLIWKEKLPDVRMINLYGPTECTGVSTYYEIPKNYHPTDSIPVGKPFKGTHIYLDKDGEILIGGTGVAIGYYNAPKLTDAAFISYEGPYGTERVYRTGDLGRFDDDGNLVFISRKDYQIKHMGHRVELGEIEADVSEIAGVSMNACVYDREKDKIVLYYVGATDEKTLTTELKKRLQRYMLPQKIIKLDNLPRTATGKIDRKKLETFA